MTIGQEFLKELSLESEVTRRYLERVPFNKKSFKPVERSEELGRLAIHVAEITAWWISCVKDTKLDFINFEPKDIQTTEELLEEIKDIAAKTHFSFEDYSQLHKRFFSLNSIFD